MRVPGSYVRKNANLNPQYQHTDLGELGDERGWVGGDARLHGRAGFRPASALLEYMCTAFKGPVHLFS